jgi:sterol desaturase/sphingolipid hydroxylase (fatty acid hydroxylase superfamily)
MDLDQYKKAWDNQPDAQEKLTALEIYKMSQSKSSSIVKWIFIIGILEFAFWIGMNYIVAKAGGFEPYERLNLMSFLNYTSYLHYAVVVLFLLLFYKNYSSISTIDDTKTLMKKILKTRKTVKWYVYYNIISVIIISIILNILIINNPNGMALLTGVESIQLTGGKMIAFVIFVQILSVGIMVLLLWLIYYLLYGILLKSLNKNYKELSKLEQVN